MKLIRDTIVPPMQRQEFWEQYANYWSASIYGGTSKLRADLAQAASRRAQVAKRACCELLKQPLVLDQIRVYHQQVYRIALQLTEPAIAVSPASWAFHHIHLMNNRLGFLTLEEAYLAMLSRFLDTSTGRLGGGTDGDSADT